MKNKKIVNAFKQYQTLMMLMLLNVLASILHYVHNVMYFDHYPEPSWLSANLVDYFWFFMTFIGAYGVFCVVNNQMKKAYYLIISYALMNMLSVLHYAVDSENTLTPVMHTFIWIETFFAVWLFWFLRRYYHK